MKILRSGIVSIIKWFLKLIFFFSLFFISVGFPVFFGVITFFLSLLIFSRLEHDKKTHERTFYSIEKPSKVFSVFFNISSKGDVLIKSLVFGSLTIILFSGTNHERTLSISIVFILLVWFGALVLSIIEKLSKLHVERWGYVKISLLLGIVFSILTSSINGIGLWEITKSVIANETVGLNLNEGAELIYALLYQLNAILENIFINIFGDFFGKVVALTLTVNVTYGFVVYIYAVQYYRLKRFYQLWMDKQEGQPNSAIPAEPKLTV